MSASTLAAVAVAGGAGAVARVVLAGAFAWRLRSGLAAGTLAVNLSGAFALGLLAGAGAGRTVLLIAGGGLLGGYTTFSTWMVDARRMALTGRPRSLGVLLAGGVLAGLAAVALGRVIGELL